MRLIDADALDLDREVELADHWKTAHEIANCVKYAPTVDAAPVVHGRWEPLKNLEWLYKCSLCGDEWGAAAKMVPMRFCPSCGAKMDLEEQ